MNDFDAALVAAATELATTPVDDEGERRMIDRETRDSARVFLRELFNGYGAHTDAQDTDAQDTEEA